MSTKLIATLFTGALLLPLTACGSGSEAPAGSPPASPPAAESPAASPSPTASPSP